MSNRREVLDTYTGPWTPGIDVSAYQPDVDWPLVARSEILIGKKSAKARERRSIGRPRFVIVRVSDGVQTRRGSKPDPWAVRHLAGAVDAGLELVDVYVYVRAWHDAAPQVAVILDALRVSGARVRTVWLDVEGGPDNLKTKDVDESKGIFWHPGVAPEERPQAPRAMAVLLEMRRLLEAEGLRVGAYSGVTWHFAIAQKRIDVSAWADTDLWTPYYTLSARYRMPCGPGGKPWPWDHATIWQVAGGGAGIDGTIAGIRGAIDANLFRGDQAALERWWTAPERGGPRGCSLPK